MTETERTETDDEYLTLTLNPLGRRNGALSGPCLAACVLSVLCFVMFGLVRTQFSRSSLETLANNLSKILSIQISSWWGGAAAQETKPYDPTDPKQNPLNPQGVKPYVIHILPVVVHNFNSFIPFSSSFDMSHHDRCCACPQTKSARDDCFLKSDPSEADEKCRELVQQHIACMRGYGFNV